MATCENPSVSLIGAGGAAKGRVTKDLAPAALIVAGFVPLLLLFGTELWSRPHYQFFPLVIPGAAALVWKYCRGLGPLEPGPPAVSRSLAAAGWLMLAVGVAFVTPWFGAVGALLALLGAGYALGGRRLVVAALPAWGFLWLAIPPPRRYDFVLIARLQNLVSRWSSELLDVAGVYHVMGGNVVEVGGRELLVDQACSGIYSLFTLLIGTVFYVLWVRSSLVKTAVLLASSVFWVLLGNVARIVAVVVLSTRWGIDAATGWKHETLGLVMFALMLGLVLSTDRLTSFAQAVLARAVWRWTLYRGGYSSRASSSEGQGRFVALGGRGHSRGRRGSRAPAAPLAPEAAAAPAPAVEPEPLEAVAAVPPAPRTVVPAVGRTWMGSPLVAAAFGCLILPQIIMPGVRWKDVLLATDVYSKPFSAVGVDAMPERVGAFSRAEFTTEHRTWDNSWGENSRVWGYRGPGRSAAVSLDYQFVEWHELTICYRSRGWTMLSRRIEEAPGAPGGSGEGRTRVGGPVVVAEFVNLEGHRGYLVFGLYDRKGRPLDPPESHGTLKLMRERLASWTITGDAGGRDGELLCYQLQVFSEGEREPSESERASIHELFGRARARVEVQGLKGLGAKP